MINLQLFINSYPGGGGTEFDNSRRARYLMEAKQSLVGKLTVVDVNTEMQQCLGAVGGPIEGIRETLAEKWALVRNSAVGIELPQAYLVVQRDKKRVTRHYIGDYQTLQYLEDCGLLDKIVTGQQCPHYRVYKGRPYFRFARTPALTCSDCHFEANPSEKPPLTLTTNFLDHGNLSSHQLCLFFEQNHLPFKLEPWPLPHHKVQVLGSDLTLERLFQLAQHHLFGSVLQGRRCMECLHKTQRISPICTKCRLAENKENVPPSKKEDVGMKSTDKKDGDFWLKETVSTCKKEECKKSKGGPSKTQVSAQMVLRKSLQVEAG